MNGHANPAFLPSAISIVSRTEAAIWAVSSTVAYLFAPTLGPAKVVMKEFATFPLFIWAGGITSDGWTLLTWPGGSFSAPPPPYVLHQPKALEFPLRGGGMSKNAAYLETEQA